MPYRDNAVRPSENSNNEHAFSRLTFCPVVPRDRDKGTLSISQHLSILYGLWILEINSPLSLEEPFPIPFFNTCDAQLNDAILPSMQPSSTCRFHWPINDSPRRWPLPSGPGCTAVEVTSHDRGERPVPVAQPDTTVQMYIKVVMSPPPSKEMG